MQPCLHPFFRVQMLKSETSWNGGTSSSPRHHLVSDSLELQKPALPPSPVSRPSHEDRSHPSALRLRSWAVLGTDVWTRCVSERRPEGQIGARTGARGGVRRWQLLLAGGAVEGPGLGWYCSSSCLKDWVWCLKMMLITSNDKDWRCGQQYVIICFLDLRDRGRHAYVENHIPFAKVQNGLNIVNLCLDQWFLCFTHPSMILRDFVTLKWTDVGVTSRRIRSTLPKRSEPSLCAPAFNAFNGI